MALQEELKQQGDFLFRYRSYFPLILLILGLGVQVYESTLDNNYFPVLENTLETAAIFVGLFGFFIRAFTIGYTPKNTSGRNTKAGQVADTLNTAGLYSLIRNPLYVGNYFMWLSIAMLTGNICMIFVFSLVFWIYYERIVFAEEEFLRRKFGEAYLTWTEEVPPFLPKHFKYSKPAMDFSWKKVLRKEKNGIFALFLVFLVFLSVEAYLENGEYITDKTWIIVGTVVTGVLYFILKFLKKYTNCLSEKDM
ncbi:MAG: isoprenylcysteine carboxylmethyltransferase family protein [Bacteroidota bacterium]|nr:isoprenylcysteine carboxylmethyltransferase family protein [Bacteroidota bacterium]